jgi:hypothetical protein
VAKVELPKNASIEQVAKVFGVTDQVSKLTPAARKLTKGELIKLSGARDEFEAGNRFITNRQGTPTTIQRRARQQGVKLSVADIRSVQAVFGSAKAVPASDRTVMRQQLGTAAAVNSARLAADGLTIYLCCCPCCCATAVLEPARLMIA